MAWCSSGSSLRLCDRLLLFLLLVGRGSSLLLLLRLLLGLLFGLFLWLRLHLGGCLLAVVIVIAAADQGQSGCSDSCPRACSQQPAP